MVDLAEMDSKSFVPMKTIAERQGISLKYLEQILPILAKNGLVEGLKGRSGGYRLGIDPKDCKVGDILNLTEGDLAPVSCLSCGEQGCERQEDCRTFAMWEEFYRLTNSYFNGITLADLMDNQAEEA